MRGMRGPRGHAKRRGGGGRVHLGGTRNARTARTREAATSAMRSSPDFCGGEPDVRCTGAGFASIGVSTSARVAVGWTGLVSRNPTPKRKRNLSGAEAGGFIWGYAVLFAPVLTLALASARGAAGNAGEGLVEVRARGGRPRET